MLTLTELHFDSFTCGYATTSEVISAAAFLPDRAAYVSCSRGRQSVKIVRNSNCCSVPSRKTPAG